MSYEAQCPQCLFVTRQLGHPTPCLLHLSLERARGEGAVFEPDQDYTMLAEPEADYDEPYAFGQLRPTVARPGPFSLGSTSGCSCCAAASRPVPRLSIKPDRVLKSERCRVDDREARR